VRTKNIKYGERFLWSVELTGKNRAGPRLEFPSQDTSVRFGRWKPEESVRQPMCTPSTETAEYQIYVVNCVCLFATG
jgi:hypothetical protein